MHNFSDHVCVQKWSDTWLKSFPWFKSGQILLSCNQRAEPTAGKKSDKKLEKSVFIVWFDLMLQFWLDTEYEVK